jgi:hypothetical protein
MTAELIVAFLHDVGADPHVISNDALDRMATRIQLWGHTLDADVLEPPDGCASIGFPGRHFVREDGGLAEFARNIWA